MSVFGITDLAFERGIATARAEGHAVGRIAGRREGLEEAARKCAQVAAHSDVVAERRTANWCQVAILALLAPAPKEGGTP